MDFLCPEIEQLVSCHTCGAQALPPYQLCVEAHVACPPCTKYQPRCACGCRFLKRSNTTLDWLVSAMKLRCKYRANGSADGSPLSSVPSQVDCSNKWYAVQDLRDHYRTGCMRNLFTCPIRNCGHVARVDTITEHYETAHGPFPLLVPDDQLLSGNCVLFQLPAKRQAEIIKKIFNGYFMFSVKPQRRMQRDINPLLSMQNINPSDLFQYTYTATQESNQKMITVTVSLVETYSSPMHNRM
ncbi:uncharacterized protein LOC111030150 [Myzus persicae]|uniref:uncharacterized protein LOC111030150 n=1 Tax=Myzus persicae TaxID=13164 RepID=UPI000B9367E6|nr:uncharacterized protein LOC111030150 [Myzus persicae]